MRWKEKKKLIKIKKMNKRDYTTEYTEFHRVFIFCVMGGKKSL